MRKPGNVSRASPGHGMHAEMFIASAQAAAAPLFQPGARVGERIEAAVAATWAVAGCNTNLGILLLCAPIAAAVERHPEATTADALQLAHRRGAGRSRPGRCRRPPFAPSHAPNPAAWATAPSQDVRDPPSVDLRAAMALAAPRDSIARQYRDGFAELFDAGAVALGTGFSLMSTPAAAVRTPAQSQRCSACTWRC